MAKTAREKKLDELLPRLRELASMDELSEELQAEQKSLQEEGLKLREKIANDRTVDEFTRTVADGDSTPAVEPGREVKLYKTREGYAVLAERKGLEGAIEAWKSGNGGSKSWGFDIRFKTDLSDSTSETGAGALTLEGTDPGHQYGGSVQPFYYPGIIEPPTRPTLIADLFAQGSTDSNLVRLVKETTTTNSAAAKDEGVAYGLSKIEVSPFDWPVKDIVTLLPVTEDIMQDIPAMSAYLGMRLAKFVQIAEENELVTGDGTGAHLIGLKHTSGRTVSAQGEDDVMTAVQKLVSKVYKRSFMDPTWIAMSPDTWSSYVTTRTDLNGGQGQFLAGPPTLAAVRQMWGLPITVTPAIEDDRIFVGNPSAGMIFRNGGLRVESSTGYGTYFGEGLVAIRAKVRTAFAVFRPQAIGELILGS